MTARTSTGSITGGCANSSGAWAIGAAATRPQGGRTAEGRCRTAAEVGRTSQIEVVSFFTPLVSGGRARSSGSSGAVGRLRSAGTGQLVLDHGIDGLSLEGFILNQEFRDTAREAGLSISVGAENTAERRDRLVRGGPEILVSDTPHMIRAMVDASPRRRSRSGGSCRRTALTTPVEILCQQR